MKLDHVTILARDLEASLRFYRGLPGMKVSPRPSRYGFVEAQGSGMILGIFDRAQWEEVVTTLPEPTGNAIIQFTVPDVRECYEAALVAGGEPVKEPTKLPWGSFSAFVRDPDGYLLELYRWDQ